MYRLHVIIASEFHAIIHATDRKTDLTSLRVCGVYREGSNEIGWRGDESVIDELNLGLVEFFHFL